MRAITTLSSTDSAHERARYASAPQLGARISPRHVSLAFYAHHFVSLVLAVPAYGCQCGGIPSATEARAKVDFVFEGTVVNRWPILVEVNDHKIPTQRYTFRVLRRWKGNEGNTVTFLDSGGNCSYHFENRRTYLVFAARLRGSPSFFSSTICLPTKPAQDAATDLAALGPGVRVQAPVVGRSESASERLMRRVTAAALVGITWLRYFPRRFVETEFALWVTFTTALALCAATLIALRFLPWLGLKSLLFGGLVMLLVSILALLIFSYGYASNHPTLKMLLE